MLKVGRYQPQKIQSSHLKYMHKIDFFAFTIPQELPFPYIELKNFANFFVKSWVFFSGIIA